jgi:hypothetical protein
MLEGLGNQLIAALPQDLETSLKKYLGGHGGDTGQAADESPPDAAPGAATPEATAGSAAPGTGAGPGPNAAARQQLDQLIQNGGN